MKCLQIITKKEYDAGGKQVMEHCPRSLWFFYVYYGVAAGAAMKQLWYHDAVLFPPAAIPESVYQMLIINRYYFMGRQEGI